MKIRTEEDLTRIPNGYGTDVIENVSDTICIRDYPYDRRVLKVKNSSVEIFNNVRIEAYGKSNIIAHDMSLVNAHDKCIIKAYDNSAVTACDKCQIEAYGKVLDGNTRISTGPFFRYTKKYLNIAVSGLCSVKAYNSVIFAYGKSSIIAHDSAIYANDNCNIKIYGKSYIDGVIAEEYRNEIVNIESFNECFIGSTHPRPLHELSFYGKCCIIAHDKTIVGFLYNENNIIDAYDSTIIDENNKCYIKLHDQSSIREVAKK